LTCTFSRKGGKYVDYVSALDISSCGATNDEARLNIRDAVRGFLAASENLAALDEILREAASPQARSNGHARNPADSPPAPDPRISNRTDSVSTRQPGDHLVYVRAGLRRPLVIPMYRAVPVFIIKNLLGTSGMARER
jgi:hypothetical protein